MNESTRRWRVLAGGVAAGVAGVIGFADATATAEPVLPQPPAPTPVTVTQTVTAAPAAAPSAPDGANPEGVTPGVVATPGLGAAPRTATAADAPAAAADAHAAAAEPSIVPATSGTLRNYFDEHDVTLEPQSSQDFTALNIVLPMPSGWAYVPDPNVPDAFGVIADRSAGGEGAYTANAAVVVYKLVGDFDPREAISHGFIDSQERPAWRTTDAAMGDFHGMPSALIEGTYRENAMALNTSRRHVIAASGPDTYLVSLSVTTTVDQAIAAASDTDAIVTGFRVSAPEPAPASPEPPPAPPSLPHLLGLPG